MDNPSLEHVWRLSPDRDPKQIFSRILKLLVQLQECGSLSQACVKESISYRHAWGLLQKGEELFDAPLIDKARGKGTTLTELGKRLIHSERLARERLAPLLASLASEMAVQIEEQTTQRTSRLQICASHCLAMEQLMSHLYRRTTSTRIEYCSSMQALHLLSREQTDMAGFHWLAPADASERPGLSACGLNPEEQMALILARRNLGLMVASGNPKKIYALKDLKKSDARVVNRTADSQMQRVFETLLTNNGLKINELQDGCAAVNTDGAIAARIAGGVADAGFGLEASAHRFGLHFIPLATDFYLLGINKMRMKQQQLNVVQAILSDASFKQAIDAMAGYDASEAGNEIQ